MPRGDLLIFNGAVWGAADSDSVLVSGERIAAVGPRAALGEAAETLDAQGGAILPGFIDAHTHLLHSGLAASGWHVDLADCSRDETLDRIAARAQNLNAGDWLVARGWDEMRWPRAEGLSRADLDRAAPRAAVLAIRIDGHVAVLNSAAIARARDAGCLRALAHAARGEIREGAVECVAALARPSEDALREALRAAAAACHRVGITTAHTFAEGLDPEAALASAGALRLRLVVHPPADRLAELAARGARSGDGDGWARWGGVKLFADGSVGARNAAVSAPYSSGGRGTLLHRAAALRRALGMADAQGWQTLVHAIGDRAIEQVLAAHRAARTRPELRHRIEHFEFPSPRHVEGVKAAGLHLCMQPNFVGNWSGPGSLYDVALGAERDAACNPFRAVLAAGVPLGLGSDGMPLSPMYGIASAVRAPHPGQRMTVDEAVRAYTAGSAALSEAAPGRGTLEVGAPADLVLLDGPLDEDRLADVAVRRTWVGGELVYAKEDAR